MGKRREAGAQGRRFTDEDKERALAMLARGMGTSEVAKAIGTTAQSVRTWRKASGGSVPTQADGQAAKPSPQMGGQSGSVEGGNQSGAAKAIASGSKGRSPYAPADPAHGLSEQELAAILEYKRLHPSMGPAQLRAQLKRFRGWRISIRAIARVLTDNGYELVHRRSRPKGEELIRFEAPRRNAIWQMDFAQFRVAGETLHVLIILDDFSRYVVGHAVSESPTSEVACRALLEAIARHGKPESVRTDRGGAFIAYGKDTDFGRLLESELIDHIVGRPYCPRGGGKVESAVRTIRRELWDTVHFVDRDDAQRSLRRFFSDYNERRAHMGIDGLTPADRFMARADQVLATIDAISRKRQMRDAVTAPAGDPIEELLEAGTGAPMEVLRLVVVDGAVELRFCGARVRLGRIQA